jgi:MarR family transcriptional regulator, organic hydroperoxide resistance regulator
MAWCPNGNELDQDIADALSEFFTHMMKRAETVADEFGVPLFAVKALHQIDEPVTMKELGRRMHVDPSFVTMIADTLERHGLAGREPNVADRRLKNLVLTPKGVELKARLERVMLGRMPWCEALDLNEKSSFLSMTRKMNVVLAEGSAPRARDQQAEEVTEALNAASSDAA